MSKSHRKDIMDREVEAIIGFRGRGRGTEYLVKWLNYDAKHNTWLTGPQLDPVKPMLDEFRKNRIKLKIKEYSKRSELSVVQEKSINKSRASSRHKEASKKSVDKDKSLLYDGDIIQGKISDTDSSELRLVAEITNNLNLNKKEETIRISDDQISETEGRCGKVSEKLKTAIDKMDKKSERAASTHTKRKAKEKEIVGPPVIIASNPDDKDHLIEAIRKDMRKALSIKEHQVIDGKLYFVLNWPNQGMEKVYLNHFFSYNDIESENPLAYVKYMKRYLKVKLDLN